MSLSQLLTPGGGLVVGHDAVLGNGVFTVFESPVLVNDTSQTNFNSLRLVADFSDLQNAGGTDPVDFLGGLTCVVEGQIGNVWHPVAYQFEPLRNLDQGKQRIVILQPDMQTFDAGIDDIVFLGGSTAARISRQQGRVGPRFRVRVQCSETDFSGPYAFRGARIQLTLERYNA